MQSLMSFSLWNGCISVEEWIRYRVFLDYQAQSFSRSQTRSELSVEAVSATLPS